MSSPYTQVYTIYGVGLFLSASFFAQRVFTKIKILGHFVVEDWLLAVAYALSIATQAIGLHMFVNRITGTHQATTAQWQRDDFAVSMLLAPIIYAPAQCFAKLSLLFFYLRITPQLWFLRISKALICIVVSYTIAITLSNLFACQPIQAAWDGSIADKQCINTSALYITTAALNIATDITMLVLPIPVVIPLQMSRRQKAEVVVIFVLGSLTFITSIVRLVYLLPLLESDDVSWDATWPVLWIGVEANLQIICASSPTLRKFLRTIFPQLFDGDPTDHHHGGARRGRNNDSVDLRTLHGQLTTTVHKSTTRRTTLRVADDMEATLIFPDDDLECGRFSHSSRSDVHPNRLFTHPHPNFISPFEDIGNERVIVARTRSPD